GRAARLVFRSFFSLALPPQRLELEADRLEILIDRLFKETALLGIELFASAAKAPALEDRHLMGELIDLELFELELFVLGGELFFLRAELDDERGGQITQLLRA